MKRTWILFCVSLLILGLRMTSGIAGEVQSPGGFVEYKNYDDVFIDAEEGVFHIEWDASPDAEYYLVAVKLLDNPPSTIENDDEPGISLMRNEITYDTYIEIPLEQMRQKCWVKVALCAVSGQMNSRWSIIYLHLFIDLPDPEIFIGSPDDGDEYEVGDSIKLRITGENYDHFYYEITCDGERLDSGISYQDIKNTIQLDRLGTYTVYAVATNSSEVNTTPGTPYSGDREDATVTFYVQEYSQPEPEYSERPEPEEEEPEIVLPRPEIMIVSPGKDEVYHVGDVLPLSITGENYDHFFYSVECNGNRVVGATVYSDVETSIPLTAPGSYVVYAVATNSSEVNTTPGQPYSGDRVEETVTFTVQKLSQPEPEYIETPKPIQTESAETEISLPQYAVTPKPIQTEPVITLPLPEIRIESPDNGDVYHVGDVLPLKITGENYHHFYYSIECDGKPFVNGTVVYENVNTNVALTKPGTYTVYAVATNSEEINTTVGKPYSGDRVEDKIILQVQQKPIVKDYPNEQVNTGETPHYASINSVKLISSTVINSGNDGITVTVQYSCVDELAVRLLRDNISYMITDKWWNADLWQANGGYRVYNNGDVGVASMYSENPSKPFTFTIPIREGISEGNYYLEITARNHFGSTSTQMKMIKVIDIPVLNVSFSPAYMNTIYYKKLLTALSECKEKTQSERFIEIAYSQIDYKKSDTGISEYGFHRGIGNANWCAAFICWCADVADLPVEVLNRSDGSGLCGNNGTVHKIWNNDFTKEEIDRDGKSYKPQVGDIVVYAPYKDTPDEGPDGNHYPHYNDWNHSAHTGIVYSVGNYDADTGWEFTTIERSNDSVKTRNLHTKELWKGKDTSITCKNRECKKIQMFYTPNWQD